MNKQITTIFVDCFNTIIGRKKHPDDVILDWAKLMQEDYKEVSYNQFFKMFKSCWKKLENIDILENEDSEFLFNTKEIFFQIYSLLTQYKMIKDCDEKAFLATAEKHYFDAEKNSHYLKKRNYNFLQKQKKLGKKIFMVSDFYCSKSIINKWLENVGVKDFFEDIFVSCDFKKSKKCGSLYRHLIGKLNLKKKEVLMFGDNLISDVINAKKQGLKAKPAKLYIKSPSKEVKKLKEKLTIPQEYIKIFEDEKKSNIYTNYAFPLYLFTKHLFEYTQRHNIKEIWFLAREGKFLQTLFESYTKKINANIKTHYFICSRKSLINAATTPYEERFKILSHMSFVSPHNFMSSLNISDESIKKISKELNLNENFFYFCFGKTKKYETLINSNCFFEAYSPYNKEQNSALWNYAGKCGIDKSSKKVFIVDSGWHGSMQKYLRLFLGDNVDLSGCYVGLDTKNPQNKNMCGLLFSKKQHMNKINKVLSYRMMNYEVVLKCEDSSCNGYNIETSEPILGEEGTAESLCYKKYIKNFQEKMLEKFEKIMDTDLKTYSNIESIVSFMFYKMMSEANNKSRNWYDNVQKTYVDTFGYIGYTYKGFGKFIRKLNYRIKDLNFKLKFSGYFKKKRLFWL